MGGSVDKAVAWDQCDKSYKRGRARGRKEILDQLLHPNPELCEAGGIAMGEYYSAVGADTDPRTITLEAGVAAALNAIAERLESIVASEKAVGQ